MKSHSRSSTIPSSSITRFASAGRLVVLLVSLLPGIAGAVNTCNGLLTVDYVSGPNFVIPGDTLRVRLTLGTGSISGGLKLSVHRLRFDLDCNANNPVGIGCTDEGQTVEYEGDPTITTTCAGVAWSTGHGVGAIPNEVVFTPSVAVDMGAGASIPPGFCTLEFDVKVLSASTDSTPTTIEQVAGYLTVQNDATCDNGLSSSGSQTGSVPLCPTCTDSQCTTGSCNQDLGTCVNTSRQVGTTCEADTNKCTLDQCDGQGHCVFDHNVTCQAAAPPCEAGEVCSPQTGLCVAQPDAPTSTSCEADGTKCTIDHCNGSGQCVLDHNVVCPGPVPPCEAGEACNAQTGNCDAIPDPAASTPCDLDATKCTVDHCDGQGKCVFDHNIVCQAPAPPCEAGELCSAQTGTCVPQADPPVSTPCDLDGTKCTVDHCNGSGQCVFDHSVTCQAPAPPCEAGELCNAQTGACVPQADPPTSTPCDLDGTKCTVDHCNGSGQCVFDHNVTCQAPAPPCEAGETCNAQTGTCVPQPDPPTSTPCDLDASKCTVDHCDGQGQCVFDHNVACKAPVPPCEGGEICNPQSGSCVPQPDAPSGTSCTDADCNVCTKAACDGSGQCNQTQSTTNCDDNDPCTDDTCDAGSGQCKHTANTSCAPCGSIDSGPCLITVDKPAKTFTNLQKAVSAAKDGAIINITGTCTGFTQIVDRTNLTIQGIPPTPTGCPAGAKAPVNLTSTLKGSPDDIIKVTSSTNIVVRFLNIVEANGSGLEFKTSVSSVANCNCIARNAEEGIELHSGQKGEVSQNLVTQNVISGIRLPHGTKNNNVHDNTSNDNELYGISLEDADTQHNTVANNEVHDNLHDGIHVDNADLNTITGNNVTANGTVAAQDSGIELANDANTNVVDGNTINSNADGLTGVIRCVSGTGNTGNNVTPACK